ncbi:MAG: hypothetical protein WC495_06220 [Patescibacteria group bacterium]|jgi:hypothetical protein
MISQKTIETIARLAKQQAITTGTPSVFHVGYINEVAQRLAEELHARKDIVALGTNLMDYMIGVALLQNRVKEHVQMGVDEAQKILRDFSEMTAEEKDEVLWCVREHHGVNKFHSLESEICCNADCYKFVSVKGFFGGLNAGTSRSYEEALDVYKKKVEEKWNALSLAHYKEKLEPQYKAIKQFLSYT